MLIYFHWKHLEMHLVYVSWYHLSPFLNSRHGNVKHFISSHPLQAECFPKLIYTSVPLFRTHFFTAALMTINISFFVTMVVVFAEYLCGLIYYTAKLWQSPCYTYTSALILTRSDLSYISMSWYDCQILVSIEKNDLCELDEELIIKWQGDFNVSIMKCRKVPQIIVYDSQWRVRYLALILSGKYPSEYIVAILFPICT